ncbi:MAG: deoxyribonuclease IV [Streptosporangiales bacterium]|nr:deoxyribonuclease IV [Streptosporangiales bacterium]
MSARPLIGSHATVTGGLAKGGLSYAEAVEAEVIQVFVSNPRGWAESKGDPRQDELIRQAPVPVFIHAPYLINLGAANPETAAKSARAVEYALDRGRQIGARGVVVHTGSATGGDKERALRQVGELMLPVLSRLGEDAPDLLLEPMAGQGQMLCARAEDAGPYLEALERHPRVGLCLDTCHLFAAGHDLRAPGGVDETLKAVERAAGADRVRLVHANDSMTALGSKRDRHETIGKGEIGTDPFRELLAHPMMKNVPFVAETPGGKAGHASDIALLKSLREA